MALLLDLCAPPVPGTVPLLLVDAPVCDGFTDPPEFIPEPGTRPSAVPVVFWYVSLEWKGSSEVEDASVLPFVVTELLVDPVLVDDWILVVDCPPCTGPIPAADELGPGPGVSPVEG